MASQYSESGKPKPRPVAKRNRRQQREESSEPRDPPGTQPIENQAQEQEPQRPVVKRKRITRPAPLTVEPDEPVKRPRREPKTPNKYSPELFPRQVKQLQRRREKEEAKAKAAKASNKSGVKKASAAKTAAAKKKATATKAAKAAVEKKTRKSAPAATKKEEESAANTSSSSSRKRKQYPKADAVEAPREFDLPPKPTHKRRTRAQTNHS